MEQAKTLRLIFRQLRYKFVKNYRRMMKVPIDCYIYLVTHLGRANILSIFSLSKNTRSTVYTTRSTCSSSNWYACRVSDSRSGFFQAGSSSQSFFPRLFKGNHVKFSFKTVPLYRTLELVSLRIRNHFFRTKSMPSEVLKMECSILFKCN